VRQRRRDPAGRRRAAVLALFALAAVPVGELAAEVPRELPRLRRAARLGTLAQERQLPRVRDADPGLVLTSMRF
jgi:hypothetical protein